MEITKVGLEALLNEIASLNRGNGYDNLFNAEHRDIMIERYGGTSAAFISIEDLMSVS
jgi:hypothetical protein